MNPVGYQGTASHRQQRLGGARQVLVAPAAVGHHIPLEPGSVPGGENHSFHLNSELRDYFLQYRHNTPSIKRRWVLLRWKSRKSKYRHLARLAFPPRENSFEALPRSFSKIKVALLYVFYVVFEPQDKCKWRQTNMLTFIKKKES